MKNRKGFTLVEVLVSMGLMAIIVITFTPLMLSSLKSVQIAGDIQEDVYDAKGEMENLISLGPGDVNEQIKVDFVQASTGYTAQDVQVEGDYLSTEGGSGYAQLDTFIAKDVGTMSISPSTVSENCPSGTVIDIFSDLIDFTSVGNFSLKTKAGNTVAGVTFKIKDVHNATMTINYNTNILISNGPYKVCYNEAFAPLYITPASVIAVGDGGIYYTRNEDGTWIKGKKIATGETDGQIGTTTLNDVIWTGTQYVTAGANANYYFTDDEGWHKIINNSSRDVVSDLLYSQVLPTPIMAAGYRTYSWLLDPSKVYTQLMTDASQFSFNSNLSHSLWMGKYVTDGFLGSAQISLWSYMGALTKDIYTYVNNSNSISQTLSGTPTSLESNRKQGAESLFMLSTSNKVYSMTLGGSVNYPTGEWKDITTTVSGNDYTTITSTKYYYVILDYNAKNGLPEDNYLVSGFMFEEDAKASTITVDGIVYNLTSGAGKDDKSDRRQIVTMGTVQTTENGSNISSANYKDITYENGIWVLSGGDISVVDYSNGAIVSATVSRPAKWAGNGWKDNASNIDAIVENDDFILNKGTSKIIYRLSGAWHISPLPNTVNASAVINKVEFIGDRFFAVGTKGTLLSITYDDLIAGKTWTKETGTGVTDTLVFNGIAGWGNETGTTPTPTPTPTATPTPTPTPATYNVKYLVDGVPYEASGVQTDFVQGVEVVLVDAPIKDGYTFSGWSSTDVNIANNKFIMPGKSVTVIGTFTLTPAVSVPKIKLSENTQVNGNNWNYYATFTAEIENADVSTLTAENINLTVYKNNSKIANVKNITINKADSAVTFQVTSTKQKKDKATEEIITNQKYKVAITYNSQTITSDDYGAQ